MVQKAASILEELARFVKNEIAGNGQVQGYQWLNPHAVKRLHARKTQKVSERPGGQYMWEDQAQRPSRNNTKIYTFYCKHKDNNYKAWVRHVGSLTWGTTTEVESVVRLGSEEWIPEGDKNTDLSAYLQVEVVKL